MVLYYNITKLKDIRLLQLPNLTDFYYLIVRFADRYNKLSKQEVNASITNFINTKNALGLAGVCVAFVYSH